MVTELWTEIEPPNGGRSARPKRGGKMDWNGYPATLLAGLDAKRLTRERTH